MRSWLSDHLRITDLQADMGADVDRDPVCHRHGAVCNAGSHREIYTEKIKRKGKKIIFSHRYIKIRVDKSQFLNIAKKEKTAEKRG